MEDNRKKGWFGNNIIKSDNKINPMKASVRTIMRVIPPKTPPNIAPTFAPPSSSAHASVAH